MKHSLKEQNKLRGTPQGSINNSAQVQQVLAQLEATLSRKENQKVTAKSQAI